MKYSDKIIASHIVKAAAALSHKWWGGDVQFYDTAANGISNGDLPKNPFCRFIQSLDDGKTRCPQNCRKQLRNACDDKKPFVFRCYAGLYGIVAPVHATVKHVGSLLCSGIHKPEQQKSFERVEIRKLTQLGFSKEEILHHWSLLKKINSHSEEYIIDFCDYVAKDISLLYEKAMAEKEYIINAVSLSESSFGGEGYKYIIGNSPAMRKLFGVMQDIERVESPVLIDGETGTGKELVASAIHNNSVRKGKPFVSYNCAALSETLLNSELFGHEKGAFTGADAKRTGIFEEADGGTLFLDEIGDMGQRAQAMLLRILQDGTFYSLGSNRVKKTDVRLITATNKNLKDMALRGLFRKDLFYRINTIHITLPPLRERDEDIVLLCTSFLSHFGAPCTSWREKISAGAMSLMKEYNWPGNVRELKNVIERMVFQLGACERIETELLPEEIINAADSLSGAVHVCANGKKLQGLLKATERKIIVEELKKSNGNRKSAAIALGISRTNLIAKIRQHNITL